MIPSQWSGKTSKEDVTYIVSGCYDSVGRWSGGHRRKVSNRISEGGLLLVVLIALEKLGVEYRNN